MSSVCFARVQDMNYIFSLINLFSPDIREMEEQKSPIFALPFHEYQVKTDLSFFAKIWGES
jgi:hypothetical protein